MMALDADRVGRHGRRSCLAWLTEHKSWDVLDEFLAKHQPRLASRASGRCTTPRWPAPSRARRMWPKNWRRRPPSSTRRAALESFIDRQGFGGAQPIRLGGARVSRARSTKNQSRRTRPFSLASIWPTCCTTTRSTREAADALEPLVKGDARAKARRPALCRSCTIIYAGRSVAAGDRRSGRPLTIIYRACQYRDQKDWQRERDELKLAIKFDPTDADVLIAMYRVPDADETWRESTRAANSRPVPGNSSRRSTKSHPIPRRTTNGPGWSATPKAISRRRFATRTARSS